MKYTLVLGLDRAHLNQLRYTLPTWLRHKPSLGCAPLIVFFDHAQVRYEEVNEVVGQGEWESFTPCPWPPPHYEYTQGSAGTRFDDAQRYKMLAGFVHVAAAQVKTKYWMKLDTDVVATGQDDWIDPEWFYGSPAAIAHRWGFTKPADQMLRLDQWVADNADELPALASYDPLGLAPEPGADRVRHRRFTSWCGLFHTQLTRLVSLWSSQTCGAGMLPCRSQDGLMWYAAARMRQKIVTPNLKERGWQQWHTWTNVVKYAQEAMR